MSLFRRSKYGSSSHSSRAVLQQLLLRNAEVRSPRQRRLREKQLSSSTQRTASTTTEGTMYDQDNNSNNIDNGFWLAPNCLTDDSKDEIDFLFCQEEHNNNNNSNNNAGPVIRARWRRRSADAVNDDPSLLLVVETPMPVADQSHNNNNNSRKDQVWMVTAREGRDDYDGSHIEEEAWGEQIEVLRRSSLNHTNNSKPFSSRGKGGFLRRTTKLFGSS